MLELKLGCVVQVKFFLTGTVQQSTLQHRTNGGGLVLGWAGLGSMGYGGHFALLQDAPC